MGMDRAPENKIAITVQIAVPRAVGGGTGAGGSGGGGGGRGQDAPPVVVHRVVQHSVTEALRDLETFTSRSVSLMHLKVIVIGRELAEAGFQSHLGILTRNRELRRTTALMVADESAEEILTLQSDLERDPALYLEDLTRRARERTARAPRIDLNRFLLAYDTQAQDPVLPIVTAQRLEPGFQKQPPTKPQLQGTAVFRQAKMVGRLTPEETEIFMLLTGQVERLIESFPSPGYPEHKAVVEISATRRSAAVDISGPVPTITLRLHAEGELREIEQTRLDLTVPDDVAQLERLVSRQLERRTNALVKKTQEEFGADIVGFGNYLRPRFIDWPSWQRYNWSDRYAKANIRVKVDTYLRKVGATFQPERPQ